MVVKAFWVLRDEFVITHIDTKDTGVWSGSLRVPLQLKATRASLAIYVAADIFIFPLFLLQTVDSI